MTIYVLTKIALLGPSRGAIAPPPPMDLPLLPMASVQACNYSNTRVILEIMSSALHV
jgi:hypothetical protein